MNIVQQMHKRNDKPL